MSDLVALVRYYSEQVKNDRTRTSIYNALVSESEELRDEIVKVAEGKPEGDDGIIGESIDVILCALDLIFQHRPDITDAEIDRIAFNKCEKWARKYGTPDKT